MKVKFSSGVIFSDMPVKLRMSENSTVMFRRVLSPSLTETIEGLPIMERKARGTKRSIALFVSLRSRMVRRMESRMVAKLAARWPISSRRSVSAIARSRSPAAMARAWLRSVKSGFRSWRCSRREARRKTNGKAMASAMSEFSTTLLTATRARLVS